MADLYEIFRFVGRAVWNVLPFFLLSIFLSVLINTLDMKEAIRRAFASRAGLAVLLATAAGAFSPFCSCTVIPVIAGLLASGVPLAPVMSFWIASPTMDPEIFTLSVGILGWPLALARLGSSLALSLAAGYLTLGLTRMGYLRHYMPDDDSGLKMAASCCAGKEKVTTAPVNLTVLPAAACCSAATTAPFILQGAVRPAWWDSALASFRAIDWPVFARRMADQSWRLGRWLLLAFTLEALITRYVPQEAIAAVLGRESSFAIPLAALVGVPLYLGNLSALPIVKGLLVQGMQPGAAIAFLMAGPVTTIPAMTAVWGVVRRPVFLLYIAISLVASTLLGYVSGGML